MTPDQLRAELAAVWAQLWPDRPPKRDFQDELLTLAVWLSQQQGRR